MKKLSFIALFSLLSLSYIQSPLHAAGTDAGEAQQVYGPAQNPDNQIDLSVVEAGNQNDEAGIELNDEEKKAFIEFNNKINNDLIYDLLNKKCAVTQINSILAKRYTPQRGQKNLLKSLEDLRRSGIGIKLIFSKAAKADNGVVEAIYNIHIGKNLLTDTLLIDVTNHYPTFSTKKCVFNSSTDYFLANGCQHGEYVYSLEYENDKNTVGLLYNNDVDFRLCVNTNCNYGEYADQYHWSNNKCRVKGQLFIDNEKSCVMDIYAKKQ